MPRRICFAALDDPPLSPPFTTIISINTINTITITTNAHQIRIVKHNSITRNVHNDAANITNITNITNPSIFLWPTIYSRASGQS